MELLVAIAVWTGVGWLLDRWLGTAPVLMAIGMVVGGATGTYIVWHRARQSVRREDER